MTSEILKRIDGEIFFGAMRMSVKAYRVGIGYPCDFYMKIRIMLNELKGGETK